MRRITCGRNPASRLLRDSSGFLRRKEVIVMDIETIFGFVANVANFAKIILAAKIVADVTVVIAKAIGNIRK